MRERITTSIQPAMAYEDGHGIPFLPYEDESVSVSRPLYGRPIREQRQPAGLYATLMSAWHRAHHQRAVQSSAGGHRNAGNRKCSAAHHPGPDRGKMCSYVNVLAHLRPGLAHVCH